MDITQQNPEKNQSHSHISPTAKLVAYWRKPTDIPYAAEVAEMSKAEEAMREIFPEKDFSPQELLWGTPYAEGRYKSILKALEMKGLTQVLELASGLSLRGLVFCENPDHTYVETDLPGIHEEKIQIVEQILQSKDKNLPPNLHFEPVNVLDFAQLERAVRFFSADRSLAIVHEGLFQYLSMDEKAEAAKNIRRILQRFHGYWITPDLNFKNQDQNLSDMLDTREKVKKVNEAIGRFTNIDSSDRAFDDENHMRDFFSKLGFQVQNLPEVLKAVKVNTLDKVSLTEKDLERLYHHFRLWCLTLK